MCAVSLCYPSTVTGEQSHHGPAVAPCQAPSTWKSQSPSSRESPTLSQHKNPLLCTPSWWALHRVTSRDGPEIWGCR